MLCIRMNYWTDLIWFFSNIYKFQCGKVLLFLWIIGEFNIKKTSLNEINDAAKIKLTLNVLNIQALKNTMALNNSNLLQFTGKSMNILITLKENTFRQHQKTFQSQLSMSLIIILFEWRRFSLFFCWKLF